MLLRYRPHQIEPDLGIAVDQPVAHSNNFPPRNVWI